MISKKKSGIFYAFPTVDNRFDLKGEILACVAYLPPVCQNMGYNKFFTRGKQICQNRLAWRVGSLKGK